MIDNDTRDLIFQTNPWLQKPNAPILPLEHYQQRLQTEVLLSREWDSLWTVLIGPRRAGKTTLGKYICHSLRHGRFSEVLYLNCDYADIRNFLKTSLFVTELMQYFEIERPIIFIDEVQRLESPGLLLKTVADLALPIKMLASGSSQLEIKSKVQEHLTGRQLVSLVLPLSYQEQTTFDSQERAIYGSYPQIIASSQKEILLGQLYEDYIKKDIVEILRIGKPDILQKLVGLLAHSSGQLVNYNQLASDSQLNQSTLKNYLSILEETYVIHAIKPYVGNKRTEITSNPIYYFIDNGFRNYALHNFASLHHRTDNGLLVQALIFQEIYKFKTQHFKSFDIYYWRTKSGAEVDFIIALGPTIAIPVEVKYQALKQVKITRSLRSYIEAYQPEKAFVLTKDFFAQTKVDECCVYFIPIDDLAKFFKLLF